jgi:hypothetical protein
VAVAVAVPLRAVAAARHVVAAEPPWAAARLLAAVAVGSVVARPVVALLSAATRLAAVRLP